MGIRIAPSILSADFVNLERDVRAVANADWLHVDVMDGHFVPNLTLGLPILERIAEVSSIPLDAHLMISNPDEWAPRYAEAGASSVTFHIEAAKSPLRIARDIRATGARAAVAIKPATPIEPLLDHLDAFDMVLIMTVEPGFGGQSFMEDMLPKFETLRQASAGTELWIQADGGVAPDTIERVVAAGADMVVAGSAVYGADDPAAAVEALRAQVSH